MSLNIGSLVGFMDLDAGPFESALGGVFDKLRESKVKGAALGAAVGGAIGLALGAAVSGGMDMEAANDKLAGQIGAGEQYAAELGKVAGKVYSQAWGESLQGVNDALRSVMTNGVVSDDATNAELESMTTKALAFAQTMDQDVGGVTRAVGQMMRTGLAKDADQAFDILTRGFQQGGDKADDLLDTFNEYGTQFRKLGIDGPTAMGLISQGLRAGARDSDIVADSIKEFSIRAVDGSDLTKASFKSLGLSVKDVDKQIAAGNGQQVLGQVIDKLRAVKDPAKQAQIATGLFGTQAEDMGKALFALDTSTAVRALGNVTGATDKMVKTVGDNAASNIESFKRQAKLAFVDVLGGQVLPFVNDTASALAAGLGPAISVVADVLTTDIVPALQAAVQWLGEHETTAKILAAVVGTVLVAALVAWGTAATVNAVKNVIAWVTAATAAEGSAAVQNLSAAQVGLRWLWMGAQALFGAARMAAAWFIALGPIGWVIAAVIGLAILVIANWKRISTWTSAAWHAITGFVVDNAKRVVGWLAANWPLILAILTGPIGLAVLFIVRHWDQITAGAARMKGAVAGKLGELVAFVKGIPGKILAALGDLAGSMVGKGEDIVRGIIRGIGNMGGQLATFVKRFVKDHIPAPLAKAMGIGSPSKVMADLAKWIPLGLVEGIRSQQGAIDDVMSSLVTPPTVGSMDFAPPAARAAAVAAAGAPGTQVQIDVHPAPGMDEEAVGTSVGRRFAALVV